MSYISDYAHIPPLPLIRDDTPVSPPGRRYDAFTSPIAEQSMHLPVLTSATPRMIKDVTFRDCDEINATDVVCRANKYQIIPPQPKGTPEEVLRHFAKLPQTVGQVKGTIKNGRTTIQDISVNLEERDKDLGTALVESINKIGERRGATCQVAENLFDIEAGNSIGPKKFWTSLHYKVKKQGDFLNAYRGDCPELQPRRRR